MQEAKQSSLLSASSSKKPPRLSVPPTSAVVRRGPAPSALLRPVRSHEQHQQHRRRRRRPQVGGAAGSEAATPLRQPRRRPPRARGCPCRRRRPVEPQAIREPARVTTPRCSGPPMAQSVWTNRQARVVQLASHETHLWPDAFVSFFGPAMFLMQHVHTPRSCLLKPGHEPFTTLALVGRRDPRGAG